MLRTKRLAHLVCLALGAVALYRLAAVDAEGTLRVEIRDKASGRPTPAMVCITSLADGKWRTPPDGRVDSGYSTVRNFYQAFDWKPGDIGPVRLTNGDYKDNDTRSSIYEKLSAYPYWREPAAYFVSAPFTIMLPAGRWRLAVAKGTEFVPVSEEFEIAAGQRRQRRVDLARWVDMPRQGWYSGDDHVHYPRLKPADDEFLMTWTQAEDLHVANIVRMGDIKRTYFEQARYGPESRFVRGNYALVTGQEDPRTDIAEQGHTLALNIRRPVRDTSRYHLYDVMFDGIRAQGGLTGYAHTAWATEWYRRQRPELFPGWDASLNVVRGKIDFLEILQFRKLGLEDYYDFLSLGFRLTASAGSDLPWGASIGEARVYAYTGPNFSVDAWFEAVRNGHTFVTNGPMLAFSVDRSIPGDEMKAAPDATLHVRATAWAHPAVGAPKTLEIVSDGEVLRTAESAAPGKSELKLEFKLEAGHSRWIAARVRSHNGALAHTTPVYVSVPGAGPDPETRRRLVAKRLKALDFIAGRLRDARFTREYAAGEVDALTERLEEARRRYLALARR
ncbi:MAG: CehA/McbA family metallohydrolase [Acidobacteria bacterium]|nr:CehA/McbA family metallohydrolase [Acidobacteriota bacterium]